jgi:microcystin-dependent protein
MSLINFPTGSDSPLGYSPSGELVFIGGVFTTDLPGLLRTDGRAISRTIYAGIFSRYGTIWGAGDGTTTFNLPNFAGRCLIGAGSASGVTTRTAGQLIGEENHILTTAELAPHNHPATSTVSDPGHFHTQDDWALGQGGATGSSGQLIDFGPTPTVYFNSDVKATGITVSTGTSNTGSGTGHNTMQPSAVVTVFVKI